LQTNCQPPLKLGEDNQYGYCISCSGKQSYFNVLLLLKPLFKPKGIKRYIASCNDKYDPDHPDYDANSANWKNFI